MMVHAERPHAGEPACVDKPQLTRRGKQFKILMLHGYTQSGPLFHAKTRALEKVVVKSFRSFAPADVVPSFIYPTAPNRLLPADIPGQRPSDDATDTDTDAEIESWAWFRRDDASGSYRLLAEGMRRLAETITREGPVDGVLGFSQGGSMAGMLAAAMEEERKCPAEAGPEMSGWVGAVRAANGGRPLRFAVVYSGFFATPVELKWLYEPKVKTPTLHFLGCLDNVVEESRSRALVDRCEKAVVVVHPGGHHVPVSKQWAMTLVGFLSKLAQEAKL